MLNSNAFSLLKNKKYSNNNQILNQKQEDQMLNKTLTKSNVFSINNSKQNKQKINFYPKQLVFSQKNSQEVKQIEIQNVTSAPIRVKFIKPQTKYFKVIYENLSEENYMLCPGLIKKIQIQFKKIQKPIGTSHQLNKPKQIAPTNQNFYDSIKISLQDKKYQIPIRAVKQIPKITYQKLIDLKFVDTNKLIKLHKKITNHTNEQIKVKLLKQSWENMHIVPQELNLKPNSDQNIEFSLTPANIGTYHHKVLVEAAGFTLDPIQIVYTTYDYNYCITDSNGSKISEVDFGYMYYGMRKTQTFYAVNNTPNTVQMKGKIRMGIKNNPLQSTFQSPQQFGQQCSSTLVEMYPKSLKINPFSRQKFTLTSMGKISQQNIGKVVKFSKQTYSPAIHSTHKRIAQTNQKCKIQDEEFHESFISQFTIINNSSSINKNSSKTLLTKNDKKNHSSKQQTIHKNPIHMNTISNIVLTELKVYYGLPMVKISPSQFDFGKIILGKPVNQKFKISNFNAQLSTKVQFNKIIGVEIFPKQAIIRPNQVEEFQIYVTPVNLGVISENLKVIVEDNYVIDCRFKYEVIDSKSLFKINNPRQKVLYHSVHNDHSLGKSFDDKINFNATLNFLQKTCHNQIYNRKNKISHSSSHHDFKIRRNNIQTSTKNRYSKESKLNASPTTDVYKSLLGGSSIRPTDPCSSVDLYDLDNNGGTTTKNKKKIDSSQIKHFQQECENTRAVRQLKIGLPSAKQNLFVTKKIDKYEPYTITQNTRKLLKSKTNKQFFSNVIKRQPRNRRQAQQISMQLKGQSLKLIKINTKTINFGKMFVGSRMQKQFIVQNQTQYSIQIKLKQSDIENPLQKLQNQMLQGTDYQQQIIPSHSVANFKICLFAKQCGKFQKAISYTINKVHEFQFLVQAQIQLAALTINKNILKMAYQDDATQMFLKDTFSLKNDGNATTQFSISQISDHFNIVPSKGIVQPGTSLDVCLTYNCQQTLINAGQTFSNGFKTGSLQSTNKPNSSLNFVDQRISVDIKNGINMSIRVTFNPTISEPKCIVKQNKLNFGVAIVSKSKSKSFLLRNLSRTMTLFQIQNNQCSQFLYFDILKGKLPPQSSKQIMVTYKSSIIQQIDSFFKINIRGGLTINVPVQAQSVAPNIRLQQEGYNFGDVCCGAAQVKPVNVINDSQTMVQLLLDLLDKRSHGTQYLYVSFVSQDNHTIFDEQTGIQKPGAVKNKILNLSSGYSTQDEIIIDNACLEPQIHKLKIPPKSVYKFYIVFKPKLPGFYEFQLPLYLQNFIKNDCLNKVITCFATEPKFIVEPSIIKFKKKIINQKQSTAFHPLIEFVTLKNPGDKQLKWKIQIQNSTPNNGTMAVGSHYNNGSIKSFNSIMNSNSSNNLLISSVNNTNTNMATNQNGFAPIKSHNNQSDTKFCFQIQNKKGQVKPGSWECINIAFNPYQAGLYCYKLPLLIYNEQRGVYQQQAEIRLQGEGQYPTLFFDRKQVIMPVVPVGVQSVAMFKVINEGYQTISLKHRIQIYDLQGNCIVQGSNYYQNNQHHSIPQINVMYPQGVKMGINKKQLYIIVKFTCKKAISFTCKLQLYDNARDCRVYSIPVSGTCDNSILTLFPYLNDLQNRYKFTPSNPQATMINYQMQKLKSKQLNNYLVNLECTDDRNAIDKLHNPYQKISSEQLFFDCEIIRRWINGFLKDEKLGKYPQDVISNPQNFLRMLYKITSKKQFQTLITIVNLERQNMNSTIGLNNSQVVQINQNHNNSQILVNNAGKASSYFNSTNNNSNNIFNQYLSVPSHFNSKLEFYQYLIKLLKSMGCLLNHIRPYFLLSKDQFFAYMQKQPNWKNMAQNYTKNYSAMHLQAWIILFYQIVSNFWYNSSKLKASLTQNDKTHVNSNLISNVYSVNQMTVLRWIKNIYQKYNEFQDTFFKFMSYGDDFKDCVGLIYAIYHHIFNPSKKKKSLEGLTKKPTTPNQITSNIRILYQLIQKVGLIPLIYQEQYNHLRQKQMFLFMYQLYEMLPQQLPKSQPIYFQCNLGEKCTKFIQIKNSSAKVVHYWIKLQGSKDFRHQEKQSIKVEPKSIYKFKVNFESRVSQEEIAYLTFLNKLQTDINNTTAAGTTLVFELRSKIVGRKSIKKLQPIYCPIYQSQTLRIPIQNQFQDCQFANFQIHLFEQILQGTQASNNKPKLYQLKKAKIQQMTQTQQSILQTDKKSNKQEEQKLILQHENAKKQQNVNFFVDNENIKIKKNSTSYIELMFNPVIYQKIRCYLIFHDPLVGQFQYEIIGISQIPKILQQMKYPTMIYTGTKQTLEVNLPVYNNYMIKANLLMEQKLYSKNGRQKGIKKIDPQFESFKVQVNMDQKILQSVTFPTEFIIKNAKKQNNSSDMISKLKIDCNFPVVIKDLALDFLLISTDKKDIRRIKLHLNIASKPIVSDLIIKTTARVPIIQPIPIQNTSIKDWRVKATLSQDEQSEKLGYLSLKQGQKLLSKDFIVKKNNPNQTGQVSTSSNLLMANNSSTNTTNTQILTLVFSPKWTCKISGKLLIQNITTNQQLIYHIKAICQQPISQGHVYFKIKTSTQQTKRITVKNPYNQSLTYKVQTDIEEMIKIPQYIYVEANGEAVVNIFLQALVPNKVIGYLKFTQDKGRFFWYTLTLQSYDDTVPQKTIDLACQVGQQVNSTLQVFNPNNLKAKYQIVYPQNCFITGENIVEVQPQKSYQVKFNFKPTSPIDKKVEVKIQSKSKQVSSYKLNLKGTEKLKKNVQILSAEVGKTTYTVFKVTNNLKNSIKIQCQLSNTKYFEVISNSVIAPKSDGQVKVQFKPLQQGKYPCILKIFGQQFQTKCYQIQGVALQPFSVEVIQMKTNIETPILQIIKFKNPNPNNIKEKVQILLEDKQLSHNCFKIITDKGQAKKWDTNVTGILGIPIQFNPIQNGYFQSMLYIKCSHYQWKYLLKGTTHTKHNGAIKQTIQGQCKKQTIKIIKIPIPKYLKKQPNFSISMLDRVDLQCEDSKVAHKIKSWMHMKIQTPIQTQVRQSSMNSQDQQVTLYCKITALQPIEDVIKLNIFNSKSQGTIRLSHCVKLSISPAEPEQTITIDVDSVKRYKFEINLQQIGVLSKKGNAVSCSMMKKQLVECRFKNIQNSNLLNPTTQNQTALLSSSKSILNLTSKVNPVNNIVQINFSPTNLTFNSNKGKNQYSDILMVYTQKQFWSCQILFKLNSSYNGRKQ